MKLTQLYRTLLRLYPREYRELFSSEMVEVFESAAHERNGQRDRARFLLSELVGLLAGATAAWMSKWTSKAIPGRTMKGATG